MPASKSLTFELYGRDRSASDAMNRVGKASFAVGAALAAAGVAAVAFGVDSVKAFSAAEDAQNRLSFAFEKFPALAGGNIAALRSLNTELQKKTRFDDDQIAASQGVLAQYDLTADQLQQITPLLLDFAAATKQDVTAAAEDLGRALLGQGRALKAIGVDFKDAGDPAANYTQLIAALSDKVQGFAEKDAETASGKLAILQNRFGDVQEKIGEALLPSLEKLMDTFEQRVFPAIEGFAEWFASDGSRGISDFTGWVIEYQGVLGPAAAALGVLTAAQWGLNIAMDANPVGLVILGLAALVTVGTLVATNWDTVTKVVFTATGGIVNALMSIAMASAVTIQSVMNAILWGIGLVADAIKAVTGVGIVIPRSIDLVGAQQKFNTDWQAAQNAGAAGGWSGLMGWSNSGGLSSGSAGGGTPLRPMAEGGLVKGGRGGVYALIGEKAYDELVVPLKPGNQFGGVTYVTNVRGAVLARPREIAKLQRNATRTARRQGFSIGDAYA